MEKWHWTSWKDSAIQRLEIAVANQNYDTFNPILFNTSYHQGIQPGKHKYYFNPKLSFDQNKLSQTFPSLQTTAPQFLSSWPHGITQQKVPQITAKKAESRREFPQLSFSAHGCTFLRIHKLSIRQELQTNQWVAQGHITRPMAIYVCRERWTPGTHSVKQVTLK